MARKGSGRRDWRRPGLVTGTAGRNQGNGTVGATGSRRATDEALEGVSHYATEPVAKKLEKGQPGLVARLWRTQGMRIVDVKKSKYYDAALSNFERARGCFRRAGLVEEWEGTVRQVRVRHGRKSGFIPGFEAIAAGAKRSEQPSFLASASPDRAYGRSSARPEAMWRAEATASDLPPYHREGAGAQLWEVRKAWSRRSALISSIPTETRMYSGVTPVERCSSSVGYEWVVEAESNGT